MGGFLHDFREFALKGNVLDLAVAVIIGAAFSQIISSLVEDVLMPAIINPVLAQAGTDWREAVIGPGIRIGSFLGAVIDFIIIALVIFLLIRVIERFRRKEEVKAAEEPTPLDPVVASQQQLTAAIETLTQTIRSQKP